MTSVVLGIFLGIAVLAWLLTVFTGRRRLAALRRRLEETEATLREATEAWKQRESAVNRREEELRAKEGDLIRREDVAREATAIQRGREKEVAARLTELERMRSEMQAREESARARLADAAGLSVDDARTRLLESLEQDLEAEKAHRVAAAANAAREEAEQRARDVVLTAVQRLAVDHGREGTLSQVTLPSDDLKGRIIGKEGRNVRAFEAASGCDVLVDETPRRLLISGFDPVRREVAVRAMRRLVEEGRIQPSRIEEVLDEERGRLEATLHEEGAAAAARAGVANVHPEIATLLGGLRYRTSYGQNVLEHSVEVALLAGMMASELGLDARVAKRVGLYHDIGKAVDHREEGPHHDIGARLLRRVGEREEVVRAVADSHGDGLRRSAYAVLAQAADGISAARPGARREDLERFLQRMRELEQLATSFPGVEKAYALRAGRELRVLVDASAVADEVAPSLARDIARAVEADPAYPGEVMVTVLRETRAVDVAR